MSWSQNCVTSRLTVFGYVIKYVKSQGFEETVRTCVRERT